MKLKPYPKYKDSGIEWIGEIPEGWEVRRIDRLSTVRRGASPRPIDDPKYFDDAGEYSWVRISDVTASNRYLEHTTEKLSVLGKSLSVPLEYGELFISIAGTVGKPIITKIKCCIHDGFVYFQNLKMNQEYLYYIFIGGQVYQGLGKLGTQLNLNTEIIGSITIPLPPKPEQTVIASFLDKKTSQIDKLIEKNQKLIELLKEKRTALINHAVTKGLDPNAKMKNSGVDWIGEIPEGWEVRKLKYICTKYAEYGLNIASDNYQTDGIRFIRTTDIDEYGNLKDGGIYINNSLSKGYTLKNGDLLISRSGTIGRTFLFDSEKNEKATYAGYLVRFSIDKNKAIPKYIFYFTKTNSFFAWLEIQSIETTIENVNGQKYANLLITIPPLTEQTTIASFLDKATEKIDKTIKLIEKKIELLEEYKKSLIHHVVTGKVDVREVEA